MESLDSISCCGPGDGNGVIGFPSNSSQFLLDLTDEADLSPPVLPKSGESGRLNPDEYLSLLLLLTEDKLSIDESASDSMCNTGALLLLNCEDPLADLACPEDNGLETGGGGVIKGLEAKKLAVLDALLDDDKLFMESSLLNPIVLDCG